MSLLKELVKLQTNEMDFAFGGSKPQPEVTDGPPPPENGADTPYDDYADYEKGEGDDEMGGEMEGEDQVTVDVPMFIKLLEWAHEEAQSDEDIHKCVENLLAMEKDVLTMDDYEAALEGIGGEEEMGGGEDEMGGGEGGDEMDAGADAHSDDINGPDAVGGPPVKVTRMG